MKHKDNPEKKKSMLLSIIRMNLYDFCGAAETDRLVLGVSGGADSTAMLHLLAQTHPPALLNAVYVDHQLRPEETPSEIKLISEQCAALGVSFSVCRVDVPAAVKSSGDSVEDAARKLRYQQLHLMLKQTAGDKICVAHTADDQIEEFFVRLVRGTGVTGLSGMKAISGNIIRPLLTTRKTELTAFLSSQQIRYSEDSTNTDLRYLRNRVRHSLLPFLHQNFHQSVGENVLRTSTILQDEDQFLDQHVNLVMKSLAKEYDGSIIIDNSSLLQHHIAIQRRIIEKAVWATGVKPSFSTINTLCELSRTGLRGKEIHLPGGLRALRQADNIQLFFPAGQNNSRLPIPGCIAFSQTIADVGSHRIEPLKHELTLFFATSLPADQTNCLILDGDTIKLPLTLRSVEPGDAFCPLGMKGQKKINRFLSDKKIEKLDRKNYPILLFEDKVLCVVGLQINELFKYNQTTRNYLIIRWTSY